MRPRIAAIRILLAFAGACLLWTLVYRLGPGAYSHQAHAVRAVATLVGGVALWAAISAATHTRRGPERADMRRFAAGAAGYLLPTLVAGGIVLALGRASVGSNLVVVETLGQGLLLLGLVLAFEAIPEELVFRDLVQSSLAAVTRPWIAILGQALLFSLWGVIIGAAGSVDRLVLFFVMSIVQGVIRYRTGSVLSTIGLHASFQLVSQWLLGGSWNAFTVHDPNLWLAGAVTIPAALLAPWIAGRLAPRNVRAR